MGKKSSSAIASIFISCVHGSSSSSSTDVDKVRLVCSVLRIFNEAQSVEKRKKKVFSVFLFLRMGGRFDVVKIRYFSVNKKNV